MGLVGISVLVLVRWLRLSSSSRVDRASRPSKALLVCFKNTRVLCLEKQTSSALLGRLARSTRHQEGDTSYIVIVLNEKDRERVEQLQPDIIEYNNIIKRNTYMYYTSR